MKKIYKDCQVVEKTIDLILQENELTETEAEITTKNIMECYRDFPESIKLQAAAVSWVLKKASAICWL